MAMIHVLDETTINKIAAGEVVERPASVIKELIENSIDAQATSIDIEIGDGGVEYMRITDNGIGMTEEDARLAVLRHATSKISSVEDLFDIASLGFRGEALASIASVSHFSLTTRQENQELGTKITVDGGTFSDCIPYGAAPGTTMEVKELFYNMLARRKFLKTNRTEASKIQDMVGKLALSNPHISFKLTVDDKVSIITPGNGDILETVAALYGYKIKDDVFPIAYESDNIYIDGVVSKPTILKSSRIWQTIIVNNRVIGDRTIAKAIDNAYHALLPKTGYPLVVLNITVPSDIVDINVHPRKSEVKFSNDSNIFKAVYHAILNALDNPLHERYERESSSFIGPSHEEVIATAVDVDKVFYNPRSQGYEVLRDRTNEFVSQLKEEGFHQKLKQSYEQDSFLRDNDFSAVPAEYKSYTVEDKEKFRNLRDDIVGQHNELGGLNHGAVEQNHDVREGLSDNVTTTRIIQNSGFLPMGQVASCYILAKKGDDLYIIDQHAAHERVRYDTLCKSAESIPMQDSLIPQFVEASDDDINLVEDRRHELLDLGFDVELGGPTQLKIVGSPVDIVESSVLDVLQYVFTCIHDKGKFTKAQLRHEMLAYASCRGAIKAGHNLNMYQMSVLIEDLFHTDKPYVCPHGRPTIIKFTPEELGKLFLRS